MILQFITIAGFFVAAHFLATIGRVFFQRNMLETISGSPDESWPHVSVIIPVRNEEHNILRCLEGLLAQSYPGDRLQIIVVDDGSTDRTLFKVMGLQRQHQQLILKEAGKLPEGWTGKNHACAVGAKQATGDYIGFVDADLFAGPHLLSSAISHAMARRIALLSLSPFQELISPAERVLLPGIFLSIASTMNFTAINDPEKPDAVANGQFLLFRRKSYDAISGHEGIKGEVMDDLAFAKKIKVSGRRLKFLFGDHLAKTRMYTGWCHIWEGFSKNLAEITETSHRAQLLGRSARFLLLAWLPLLLFPAAYAFYAQNSGMLPGLPFFLAIAGTTGMLCTMMATVKTLKLRWWHALCFPISLTVFVLILINSFIGQRRGKRVWKGRRYQ